MTTHGDIMKGDLVNGGMVKGGLIHGDIIHGDFTKGDMKTTGELTQGCVVTTSHILSELLTQGYVSGHPPDTDVIVCTLREEGVSNVVTSTVYPTVPTSPADVIVCTLREEGVSNVVTSTVYPTVPTPPTSPVNNTLDVEVEVLSSCSEDRNGSMSTPTQDDSSTIVSPTKPVIPADAMSFPDISCVSSHLANATSMSPHRSTSIAPRGSNHYAQTSFFSPSSPQIRYHTYLLIYILLLFSDSIYILVTPSDHHPKLG